MHGLAQTSDTISYSPYDLWMAADTGNLSVVKACLEKGMFVDISDENSITALMLAAQSGHLSIVEYLAIHDADINAKPKFPGISPLSAAVRNDRMEVAEYLIRHGAKIAAKDDYGKQALHYAAEYGYVTMVDMLIYYEAPVDTSDGFGKTPLYFALVNNHIDIAQLLVENGADVLRKDSNGNNYLHIVAQNDTTRVADFLLNTNIDITDENLDGLNAFDIAVYNGNLSLVKQLAERGMQARDSITPFFNTRTLANNSGNKKVRKFIKQQKIPNKYYPYFQYVDLGWDLDFNLDDFMMGFNAGVYDTRYGIKLYSGLLFRMAPKWVWLNETNQSFLQVKEERWGAYLGVRKYFRFKKSLGIPFQLFTGVSQYYTKPSYDVLEYGEAGSFILMPEAGLCVNLRNILKLEFAYKYCDFNRSKISPHRVSISFVFGFNFRSEEMNDKNRYIIKE